MRQVKGSSAGAPAALCLYGNQTMGFNVLCLQGLNSNSQKMSMTNNTTVLSGHIRK